MNSAEPIREDEQDDTTRVTGARPASATVAVPVPRTAVADGVGRDAIRALLTSGFRICFDAMHAVTGPYAREILERRLGAGPGSVINGEPRPDFGGGNPDPTAAHARELVSRMYTDVYDFGAASDGDGDRNMILGRRFFVTPSDALAVLTDNANLVPGYAAGLTGVARSMPTSQAVDRVARALRIPCHETPTGWKYFANLLDTGLITLCGEESYGTGSTHVREKDGLWAVLFWLNVIAVRGQSVEQIVREHWNRYGRNYFIRRDYEQLPEELVKAMMEDVATRVDALAGVQVGGEYIRRADDFTYRDPVDGEVATGKGIRIRFEDGSRAVVRTSGTGTHGATLRIYLERFASDPADHDLHPPVVLEGLLQVALELLDMRRWVGPAPQASTT